MLTQPLKDNQQDTAVPITGIRKVSFKYKFHVIHKKTPTLPHAGRLKHMHGVQVVNSLEYFDVLVHKLNK